MNEKRVPTNKSGKPGKGGKPGNSDDAKNNSSNSTVVDLWEKSEPYRGMFLAACGVVAVIAGGVSWLVSYFATQAQLQEMECQTNRLMHARLLPLHQKMDSYAIKIRSTLMELESIDGRGLLLTKKIAVINRELNEINSSQQLTASRLNDELEKTLKACGGLLLDSKGKGGSK
jgi:hypothetical protein